MPVFEVFGRRKADDPLEHVGAVHAADPQAALVLVRETHFRHNEGVDYAVVPADQVFRLDDPSILDHTIDMDYRLQAGYSGFREKRQAAREAADRRGRQYLRERPAPGRASRVETGS